MARGDATRRAWAKRKEGGWQSAAVRHEARLLDDLRRTVLQARFGSDLVRLAEWCVSTCIAAGSSVHTAYLVAGAFTEGLAREWAATSTEQRESPE